jgi:predicted ATPase
MMTTLAISGYRSLRDVRVTLAALNVVTGANGSGKSSLYRALKLLADIAQGRIIQSLAAEGGLQSTLWAGPEAFSRAMKAGTQPVEGVVRKNAISLKLGFSGDDYGYAIDLGLPSDSSIFSNDPAIKVESLWTGERLGRANAFAVRNGPYVRIRNDNGEWRDAYHHLAPFDSMMTHCSDPREALELLLLRERMRDWRFYDHLRTDRDAPSRKPQVATYTPVLAGDGSDLAAAVATIRHIGAAKLLDDAVADAFPGGSVHVSGRDGYSEVEMRQHGLLRPLKASELSDGTLRYLLLVAALLSPRPPSLMILNEPETSLHPDLLPPLARLIEQAAKHSQVVVVSHAAALVSALEADANCVQIVLEKELGETVVRDSRPPNWTWPSR